VNLVGVVKVVQGEGYCDILAAARIGSRLVVGIGREKWADEGLNGDDERQRDVLGSILWRTRGFLYQNV
jgi:hypothetical protein